MTLQPNQHRFLRDLDAACAGTGPQHVVLLSGGLDSLAILACLVRRHGPDAVLAATLEGAPGADPEAARKVAEAHGVYHQVLRYGLDEFRALVPRLRGTGYRNLFDCIFRLGAEVFLDWIGDLSGRTVYVGQGADSLYGTTGPFQGMQAKKIAALRGLEMAEAREVARREYRAKARASREPFSEAVAARGGEVVLPYMAGPLEWVLDAVPMTEMGVATKRWVRDALREGWGVPEALARRRIAMELGLGWYYEAKAWALEDRRVRSGPKAAQLLCAGNVSGAEV